VMEVLAQFLGVNMGHDFIEDAGRAILDIIGFNQS
jgi:hypothetical protein